MALACFLGASKWHVACIWVLQDRPSYHVEIYGWSYPHGREQFCEYAQEAYPPFEPPQNQICAYLHTFLTAAVATPLLKRNKSIITITTRVMRCHRKRPNLYLPEASRKASVLFRLQLKSGEHRTLLFLNSYWLRINFLPNQFKLEL